MTRRVAITGAGVVSAFGVGLPALAAGLVAGRSGVVAVPRWAELGLASTVAALVPARDDLGRTAGIQPERLAAMSPAALLATVAAREAAAMAGLAPPDLGRPTSGCVIGSGIGGTSAVVEGGRRLAAGQARRVSPFSVLQAMASSASAAVALDLGIGGRSYSLASACATSAHAVGHAAELVRHGLCEVVVAGGGEAVDEVVAAAFTALRTAVSTHFNDRPAAASRPFAADRDGFVLGEGAGVVVVETWEAAVARGASILAEVVGFAANSDRHDLVLPPPDGAPAAACMAAALADAGLAAADVDLVSAHATGTVAGDLAEAAALDRVLGVRPAVTATKSALGHTLGGAGAIELVAAMVMLGGGFVAPSLNLERVDPAAARLDLVTATRPFAGQVALSNSFGFGGTNACLVVRRGPAAGRLHGGA